MKFCCFNLKKTLINPSNRIHFHLFILQEGLFFSNPVQSLLTRLTGMDYDRIFRVAKLGQHISAPQYQFLTDAELKKAQQKALKTAKKLLQMPPVMDVRETTSDVLDHDSAIEGYDSAKVINQYWGFSSLRIMGYFNVLHSVSIPTNF